ncbi:hypothetical protein COO60DRAFT_506079 [Scenedesmus sp. NREL 46B-D3]|nr:hypothetical protein COO60DRAFT_506079 [Scenedesmus sp. NREL 46B-D3]
MASVEHATVGADLFSVLPVCSKHCQYGLQVLACLAASSKRLKDTCVSVTQRDAVGMLMATLHEASTAAVEVTAAEPTVQQQKQQQQYGQAVAWLLHTAPAIKTIPGIAERLRQTPAVPLGCVLSLVAAGVRISLSQLLAAANSMVAGVEVWVQAQQQLGVQTDIPETAISICCDGDLSYLMCPGAASHDTAVGLLQLAMNCSNHFTAAAAAMVVLRPLPLEPFAFRKLLLTAVQRQHTGAVQFMTVNPAVLQHVDAPMLEAVLKCLVAVLFGTELCVDMLLHLPAAEQLSSVAVMQLLQAAAQRRADVWVSELCTVPAAQQLIGADVAQLLQAAVPVKHQGCGNARCVSHICRLRGVQQLSSDVVRGLIRVAVEHGGVVGNSAEPLRKLLPAAQQLSRDELTSLLQAALGPHDSCAHMQ